MQSRREFLRGGAAIAGAGSALALLPASIRRALAIPANRRKGTIEDIEHIVIFMQENRSFDHYFGGLAGVRGFGDRFPIPVPASPDFERRTVWAQYNGRPDAGAPRSVLPFRLDTGAAYEAMRVASTPHTWSNAQDAWDAGRMGQWPAAKKNHSMAYYTEADMPFQYAMARAFTVCDAYHCSFTGGTNTNRLFLWSGTNDGLGRGHGPSLGNTYNKLGGGDPAGAYTWTTYPERLERAGIRWRIYQDMADNYSLNPTAGFKAYRDAYHGVPGSLAALKDKALTTRGLDQLRQDVLDGTLPQVSWICATKAGSEHPSPSSPAQGADYTAKVLDALTANPDVWSKTVLLLMFDENDGFFDHMPPPAVPDYLSYAANPAQAQFAGASTVDTTGEYHHHLNGSNPAYHHRPYGMGPRVPMYVISPWSKGGWVNSQVSDHTSVIRFLETRFGVQEPLITPWRRAVSSDLSGCFDFATPEDSAFVQNLPATEARRLLARALPSTKTPATPSALVAPVQAAGVRPARALPYDLHVHATVQPTSVGLRFVNEGEAGAVFHVYNRRALAEAPRRYTVEPGKHLDGVWTTTAGSAYDLWVLGPNGLHRHFTGATPMAGSTAARPDIRVSSDRANGELNVQLINEGNTACTFVLQALKYDSSAAREIAVPARSTQALRLPLADSHHWYDQGVRVKSLAGWSRRFAGHLETGEASISDPAMQGTALLDQYQV